MFALANEPQGIGRNLDNGFRLLFAGIGAAALLLLIMIVIDAILFVFMGSGFFSMMSQMEKGQLPSSGLGSIALFFFLLTIVNMLFNNALIANYGAVAYQQDQSLGGALATGARKLLPVIVYAILYTLILTVSALPLIILMAILKPTGILAVVIGVLGVIPPMILGLSLYFGAFLIIIDGRGIIESISASHKLVWGNWWRTLLYITIIFLIMFAVVLAIQLVFGLITALLVHAGPENGNMTYFIILQVVNQLVSLIFMPVMIALIIPYLHDLKLRKEGGDLASRISAA